MHIHVKRTLAASGRRCNRRAEAGRPTEVARGRTFPSAKVPLNVYKKARCANTLRWALLDKGYPKPFVEAVVRLVVTRL